MIKKRFFIFTILIIILLLTIIIAKKNYANFNSNKIYISNDEIELQLLQDKIQKENYEETINKEKSIDKLFEYKVLDKECDKRNIIIEDKQKENLKNISFNNVISDENKEKIEQMNMTEEEFRKQLYEKLINMQKRVKLKEELLIEINNNNVKSNNSEFKQKVADFNQYKNSENNNTEELILKSQNLINEYIEILKKEYIKIVD